MKQLIACLLISGVHCKSFFKKPVLKKAITICVLVLSALFMQGQQDKMVMIKGVVVTQEGDPLPGVSIVVKGSSKGTSTKADGSFSFEVPANSVLLFSY